MGWKADVERLKKLGKAPRDHSELQALVTSLNKESDKTVALTCSALIEEALEELLLSRMVPLNSEERGRLFRGFGPLASYAGRTALAYAFGLIDGATKRNLDISREVRNALAHARRPMSFSTPAIGAVCAHLSLVDVVAGDGAEMLHETMKRTNTRSKYLGTTLSLWAKIIGDARNPSKGLRPLKVPSRK